MALEEELDAAWEKYAAEVESIGMRHLRAEVFPLFKRRKYRALAGNGTCAIFDKNNKLVEADPVVRRITFGLRKDPDLERVHAILSTSIPGMPCMDIGSYLCEYPLSKTTTKE